jgi:hypothetical protein
LVLEFPLPFRLQPERLFLFALQALQGMAKQCAAQTSTGGSELIRVPIQRL